MLPNIHNFGNQISHNTMSTLERAIEIATEAHRGQLDKAGNEYIQHPLRVMADRKSTRLNSSHHA